MFGLGGFTGVCRLGGRVGVGWLVRAFGWCVGVELIDELEY